MQVLAVILAVAVLLAVAAMVARPSPTLGVVGILACFGGIATFASAGSAIHEILGALLLLGGLGLVGIGAGIRVLEKILAAVSGSAHAPQQTAAASSVSPAGGGARADEPWTHAEAKRFVHRGWRVAQTPDHRVGVDTPTGWRYFPSMFDAEKWMDAQAGSPG